MPLAILKLNEVGESLESTSLRRLSSVTTLTLDPPSMITSLTMFILTETKITCKYLLITSVAAIVMSFVAGATRSDSSIVPGLVSPSRKKVRKVGDRLSKYRIDTCGWSRTCWWKRVGSFESGVVELAHI